ncbi:unnamed protein product [Plutella xylostella]|uniref:(diamondback moth) hypothetical protein n=1 Tax=Plutella xylostella TaxID=51655 RepID=A0A8S4E488_PLUXY|nr:unnamed protein product [Plutella xylostella]
MAMNKKCPIFMKERQIRETMSKNNCTYRKALNDYLSKTEKEKELEQIPIVDHAISRATNNSEREKSYRDVVVGQVIVHENIEESSSGEHTNQDQEEDEGPNAIRKVKKVKKKKDNRNSLKQKNYMQQDMVTDVIDENNEHNANKAEKESKRGGDLRKFWKKIKDVLFSKKILEDKLYDFVTIVVEECSVRTTQNDWEDIFGLCSQGALVTGDFNGHHTNWSYKSDARGIQILDAALENGFVSLNDGSPTRVKGNEEADRLAKLAASDGTETFIEPDYSEKFNLFKKVVYDEWKEYFNERSKEKGIWYKAIQSEPPRIPWFGDIKINRSEVVLAHRLRSGHIPLNRFAYLMKKVDSPNCDALVVQHVDVCMFSNGKFKNVVALVRGTGAPVPPDRTLTDTLVLTPHRGRGKFKNVVALVRGTGAPVPPDRTLTDTLVLTPHRGVTKNWIALEDSYSKTGASLASTVLCNSNTPEDRNVFAIYVSYYVKVKLTLSAMGGEMSLKLPFTLTHSCINEAPTDSVIEEATHKMILEGKESDDDHELDGDKQNNNDEEKIPHEEVAFGDDAEPSPDDHRCVADVLVNIENKINDRPKTFAGPTEVRAVKPNDEELDLIVKYPGSDT